MPTYWLSDLQSRIPSPIFAAFLLLSQDKLNQPPYYADLWLQQSSVLPSAPVVGMRPKPLPDALGITLVSTIPSFLHAFTKEPELTRAVRFFRCLLHVRWHRPALR